MCCVHMTCNMPAQGPHFPYFTLHHVRQGLRHARLVTRYGCSQQLTHQCFGQLWLAACSILTTAGISAALTSRLSWLLRLATLPWWLQAK